MPTWQEVRCPDCHKVLFEATGVISTPLLILIHCRCKRVLQINERFEVEIFQERQPTRR